MWGAGARTRKLLVLVFRAMEVCCVVGEPSPTFLSSVLLLFLVVPYMLRELELCMCNPIHAEIMIS